MTTPAKHLDANVILARQVTALAEEPEPGKLVRVTYNREGTFNPDGRRSITLIEFLGQMRANGRVMLTHQRYGEHFQRNAAGGIGTSGGATKASGPELLSHALAGLLGQQHERGASIELPNHPQLKVQVVRIRQTNAARLTR